MTPPSSEAGARAFFGRCARMLLVVSFAVTVAGLLGRFHGLLELFSHFVAWYAAGSFVLLIVLVACRRWRWSGAAAVLLVFQAAFPLSWYWNGPGPDTAEAPNVRILLANVLSANENKQALLELVRATDPDVICVQEVTRAWVKAMEPLEKTYSVHLTIPRHDNFGIAVYSRLPGPAPRSLFEEAHHVPAIAFPVEINGRPVNILTVHTLPPVGRTLAVRRNAQLASVRAWMLEQDQAALVIGDLNTTMFSPIYRQLTRGTDIRNAREGFGPLGTWPAHIPLMRLPLDHVLVRGDIRVAGCVVGPDIGSDHRPLIVDVWMPGE